MQTVRLPFGRHELDRTGRSSLKHLSCQVGIGDLSGVRTNCLRGIGVAFFFAVRVKTTHLFFQDKRLGIGVFYIPVMERSIPPTFSKANGLDVCVWFLPLVI